jgi:hypothetical protein
MISTGKLFSLVKEAMSLAETTVERFSASGTIRKDTNLAISTGTHTLTMPVSSKNILNIKSKSGTATLEAGSNTFESSGTSTETVTTIVNKIFYLDGTVWIEL